MAAQHPQTRLLQSRGGRAATRYLALAAAILGLAIGIALGGPVVSWGIEVWNEVVTPGFLNLYLSGFALCS
ncbi:MAG: hypothetical protein QNJ94_12590 [Alphaproteobacteria bacterium]|nr:hypothetical protein [Alphaproteobacteria bacterium]